MFHVKAGPDAAPAARVHLLHTLDRVVKVRIGPLVFDDATGMRDRRPVACECASDRGEGQTTHNMRDVHANLTGESDTRTAPGHAC
jgi:hypothetical protein